MSKKILPVLVILALVVLAAAALWWQLSSSATVPATTVEPNSAGVLAGNPEKISTTLLELVKLGKNYQCSFTTDDPEAGSTEGAIYLAEQGKKLRANFYTSVLTPDSKQQPTMTQAHVITDGEYSYFWSDDQKMGMKMKLDPSDTRIFGQPQASAQASAPVSDDQNYDFDCKPWSPDTSFFTPPTDIEFTDFSQQMEQMKQMQQPSQNGDTSGAQPTAANCSVCDQVPDASAKAQCREAMGC